ncbi:MAG: hypothetical protein MUC88_26550 [Planctomycetes bacterium]|jgi:hypothetical protein|nr:hypothetical protein [Planctomycetota bacterium]
MAWHGDRVPPQVLGLRHGRGMEPQDALGHTGTQYVLARPGERYVVYASNSRGRLGLRDMTAGKHTLLWLDCVSGATVFQESVSVSEGSQTWPKPAAIGNEMAVYLRRVSP